MTLARSSTLAVLLLCGAGMPAQADTAAPEAESAVKKDAAAPAATGIDPGATTIEALRMEIYLDREMRAFGDAEINRDGEFVSGDRIDFNSITKELHATGNVHLKQGDTIAEGPELRLKMDEREGEMTEPIFHLGVDSDKKSRGSALTMLFEGPIKERLKSVRYTTCPDGVDDWFLRAGEMEIDHHSETASATNASIEFKGMPILYTPWIDFPFGGNQRKSGFLSSTFGSTSLSGFEFMLPYYWNISPNRDATLTPRYLSKRGVQLQGEYRYLETDYHGTANLEILPDDSQTGKNRFHINLAHDHIFGNGWSGGIRFERVSDDQYFSDLTTHITVTSQVNLQQQANLNYNGSNWHFSALAQQYQTLDRASYPYQRLPQLTLTGTEDFGPVNAALSSEFVRFGMNSAAPPTVTGNRFTLYPSVRIPFTQSYGYVTPKIGVHYTGYNLDNAGTTYDSSGRAIPIFSLDSGLYFDRDVRVVKNTYTNTLEPRLFYVYIPYRDQSRQPVFDTGLSDLNLTSIFAENQFAGGDRVNDANQLTMAVTSRLIDQKTGVQRLAATVGERFYFADQKVTLPGVAPRIGMHSDLLTALTVKLINGWNADADWEYNSYTGATIKSDLTARYQPEAGKVLNLSYRYTQGYVSQVDASAEWPLTSRWYGLGRLSYFLRDNPATFDKRGPSEYLLGLEYNAGCWVGRAVLHRLATVNPLATAATANYALFFQLELGGLSKIGSSPLDVLKRNIPGYTSTSMIPDGQR